MKSYVLLLLPATFSLFLAGCTGGSGQPENGDRANRRGADQPKVSPEEQARIATALARLEPEDRALAEAQQYCAVESENRLGLMGTPVKVLVNDEPVFVCCKSCKPTALAEPEKTLAKAKQLKGNSPDSPGH
jgi:hypothetical protein